MIAHSKPSLGNGEIRAVSAVIKSGQRVEGREVELFEKESARSFAMKNAAAVSSGTAALELALRALGAGPGDEVIIPSYCCSALWHAAARAGAKPVLCDCDLETLNPSAGEIKKKLTKKTKAAILPNLFGLQCEIPKISGLKIIQDCAQAAGAKTNGKFIGNYGDACVLSFYATKLLTTGEGGMVLSHSEKLVRAVKDLREYDGKPAGIPRSNYKMTDIQAAIGRVQLKKLPAFLKLRSEIAAFYDDELKNLPVFLPPKTPGRVYHRYVVRLKKARAGEVISKLNRLGVAARRPVFRPVHFDAGGAFPNADAAYQSCVSLPLYPALAKREAEKIVSAFRIALL